MVLHGHIGSRRLVRAFVAIPTPEDIVRRLLKLTAQFQWPGCKLRWSTPDQFHMTVQFLGNVEWIEIGKIGKTLKEVAAPFPPMTLSLAQLATFPPRNQPRVIVATLVPNATLTALVQALQDRLQKDHQIVPESRNYKAHVTLGRVKSVVDAAAGEALRADLAAVDPDLLGSYGDWDVDELTFFQSAHDDGRSEYIELSHAALKGGSFDAPMETDGTADEDEEEDEVDSENGDDGGAVIEIDLDAEDEEDEGDEDGEDAGDDRFRASRGGRGGAGDGATQAKSLGEQVAEALAAKARAVKALAAKGKKKRKGQGGK